MRNKHNVLWLICLTSRLSVFSLLNIYIHLWTWPPTWYKYSSQVTGLRSKSCLYPSSACVGFCSFLLFAAVCLVQRVYRLVVASPTWGRRSRTWQTTSSSSHSIMFQIFLSASVSLFPPQCLFLPLCAFPVDKHHHSLSFSLLILSLPLSSSHVCWCGVCKYCFIFVFAVCVSVLILLLSPHDCILASACTLFVLAAYKGKRICSLWNSSCFSAQPQWNRNSNEARKPGRERDIQWPEGKPPGFNVRTPGGMFLEEVL